MQLTFNSQPTFRTTVGATISLLCGTLFLTFFVIQTMKIKGREEPFFSMTSMAAEEKALDLWELGFMFAVEQPDPRVGHIDVKSVSWNEVNG